MLQTRLVPVIVVTCSLAGPAFGGEAADHPLSGQIETANARFMAAYKSGDGAAVAAMYTETGRLLPPNQEVVAGRAAIAEFWSAAMAAGAGGATLKSTEVEGFGDTAVEVGVYTLAADDGTELDRGKYIVVWKRVNGHWRLHRDCWNSSQSLAKTAD